MGRASKYLLRLAVLAVLGLVAYALLADLPAPTHTVRTVLDVPPATGGTPETADNRTAETADAPADEPEGDAATGESE